MSNKYSKLQIDKNKLPEWINIWCEANIDSNFQISKKETNNRIQFTISSDNQEIKIDFQKCNGNLLTICPNVGKNIAISGQIAEDIYQRVASPLNQSPFAHGFSIKVSEDDFQAIIQIIKEMDHVKLIGASEQNAAGKAQYKLYRFSGPSNDSIVIKYYPNTSRMQMQGKPLFLFNEVVALVSENGVPKEDIVDAHLRYCNIELKSNDIFEELASIVGRDLYDFLSTSQKAILSTSLIFDKIDVEMPDYSIVIQPANRAYEGFVKKIYAQKGLSCDGDQQLGKFYRWIDPITPVMKTEYSQLLDATTVNGFTSMFKFYTQSWHPFMHASAYDYNTAIISDRSIAEEKLNSILLSMKTWFEWYQSL